MLRRVQAPGLDVVPVQVMVLVVSVVVLVPPVPLHFARVPAGHGASSPPLASVPSRDGHPDVDGLMV